MQFTLDSTLGCPQDAEPGRNDPVRVVRRHLDGRQAAMTGFEASAVAFVRDDDFEAEALVLAENADGSGQRLWRQCHGRWRFSHEASSSSHSLGGADDSGCRLAARNASAGCSTCL